MKGDGRNNGRLNHDRLDDGKYGSHIILNKDAPKYDEHCLLECWHLSQCRERREADTRKDDVIRLLHHIAKHGSHLTEMAVLLVLFEARQAWQTHGLGAAAISRATGIYRKRNGTHCLNDAIVTGTLFKLLDDGKTCRISQENNKGGWGLTNEFYDAMLRGEIELGEFHKYFGLGNEQD